jgi:YggT family protein
MYPLFWLLDTALGFYKWVIIAAAVMSMLVSFQVLDTRNRLVWQIGDFLYRLTEPVLRPIRERMPNLGGIDLSPLVVIVLLQFLQLVLARIYMELP